MSYNFNNKIGLICGASQGIGLAIAKELLHKFTVDKLFITARALDNSSLLELKEQFPDRLFLLKLDASNNGHYHDLASEVKRLAGSVDFIINSIGSLKFSENTPERRVEDINSIDILRAFEVNTLPSLLLAKHFKSLLRKSDAPLFCTLSAKVGSIDDNGSGGWYGYRMSKAALNMALKNLSIEFKRLNNNIIVASIHPGTTETNLTKDFLETARKKYKIHSPEQTASNILSVLKEAKNGQFLSWDKAQIKW